MLAKILVESKFARYYQAILSSLHPSHVVINTVGLMALERSTRNFRQHGVGKLINLCFVNLNRRKLIPGRDVPLLISKFGRFLLGMFHY